MQIPKAIANKVLPILLGGLAFAYVIGFGVLNPHYIGWLMGRYDPIQHYLGWEFFRHSEWMTPIGLSPSFGLDISSSIVYSDSIPLMAFIFKLFDYFLPLHFQYFGIWLLICFLLQAYFGWKIASLYFDSFLYRSLVTTIFVLSPPLLWRLNTHAGVHTGLASHFLILAGIYLTLKKGSENRYLYWTLLLIASLTIHFYFLIIISFLWCADSLDRCIGKSLPPKKFAIELLFLLITILFFGWQVGYFAISTSSVDIWGYGFFRLNMIAPIDSYGLSTFMPNMNLPTTWGEGYSYIGLGVLLGFIFSIPYFFKNKNEIKVFVSTRPALLMVLILFFLLSITNNIGIGAVNYLINLPEYILKVLSITRSAARFFWAIYYFLIIFIAYAIYCIYPRKISLIIFCCLTSIQVLDLHPLSNSIKSEYAKDLTGTYDDSVLKNALWTEAAKKYKKLILIPAMNHPPYWETFAFLALKHGIATNSIFTARIDSSKVNNANKRLDNLIELGKLDVESFYIAQDRFVLPILAYANSDSPMLRLDGFNIFLPNWKQCQTCTSVPENYLLTIKKLNSRLGEEILFSSNNDRSPFYLGSGWSWLENWGVWSDSPESFIYLPMPYEDVKGVNLNIQAFVVHEKKATQAIQIFIDDSNEPIKKVVFTDSISKIIKIPITRKISDGKIIKIKIDIENPVSPKSLNIGNDDARKLGIGLISASFY